MSIRTDTANEEVDATSILYHLLIMTALFLQVLGIAIQDVDVLLWTIDVIEQVGGHERVIALWV